MARPPDSGVTRDELVKVRVTAAEKARYNAAAKKAGVDLSTWARDVLSAAAASKKAK